MKSFNNAEHTVGSGVIAGESAPNALSRLEKWKAYYELTKPGITKMVVITASAGYYLAIPSLSSYFVSAQQVLHCVLTIIGVTLVSGGSCALNHYVERDVDSKMKRTRLRPIPSGKITPLEGLAFGVALSALGLGMLVFVNFFTLLLAAVTLVSYVAIYTPLKRKSSLSTLFGGIPGALPPVGGWVAVTGSFDIGAALFFLLMFFWQIPHFLALSWMYKKDYADGGLPMLAVMDEKGTMVARQALLYALCLVPVNILLTAVGVTGMIYCVGATVLSGVFVWFAWRFLRGISNVSARKLLLSSYAYLMGVIALMFIDKA